MTNPPTGKAWYQWLQTVAAVLQVVIVPAAIWAITAEKRLQNHEDTHQTIEAAVDEHRRLGNGIRSNERVLDALQPNVDNLDEKLDDFREAVGVQLQRMEQKLDESD